MTADQRWRRTLAWLRRTHPPRYKVSVRRICRGKMDDPHEHGAAWYDEDQGRFFIHIRKEQGTSLQRDTLFHEWAHCMTWFGADANRGEDHGGEWGLAHAKVYGTFLEWWEGASGNNDTEGE
jgi:hypothetical protein